MIDKTVLHDFMNNGIRIEILTKLIAESLEKSNTCEPQQVSDLSSSLELHQALIKKLN